MKGLLKVHINVGGPDILGVGCLRGDVIRDPGVEPEIPWQGRLVCPFLGGEELTGW
jgi:hypothetical protein